MYLKYNEKKDFVLKNINIEILKVNELVLFSGGGKKLTEMIAGLIKLQGEINVDDMIYM